MYPGGSLAGNDWSEASSTFVHGLIGGSLIPSGPAERITPSPRRWAACETRLRRSLRWRHRFKALKHAAVAAEHTATFPQVANFTVVAPVLVALAVAAASKVDRLSAFSSAALKRASVSLLNGRSKLLSAHDCAAGL